MKYKLSTLFAVFAATMLMASPAMADDDASDDEASPSATNSTLEVLEAKSAADVEDREAVGESDSFSEGDTVAVWMAVQNNGDPDEIEVAWHFEGDELHTFDIEIGTSPRWRTWASTTASRTGDWSVEIRDNGGETLETIEFSVSE